MQVAGACGRKAIGIDYTYPYLVASMSDCALAHGDWSMAQKYALQKPQKRLTLAAPDRANAPECEGSVAINQLAMPGIFANPPGQVS